MTCTLSVCRKSFVSQQHSCNARRAEWLFRSVLETEADAELPLAEIWNALPVFQDQSLELMTRSHHCGSQISQCTVCMHHSAAGILFRTELIVIT